MIAETTRLIVRKLTPGDAPLILRVFNDPTFVRFVGDKHVRTLDEAREYIRTVPMASYARHGFGHYVVELRETHEPIGICSLVKRDWLDDVDLGFAFLPAFRRRGYATEAATAVLDHARSAFGLDRLVAIASPANAASIAVLQRLGFRWERTLTPPDEEGELALFANTAPPDTR